VRTNPSSGRKVPTGSSVTTRHQWRSALLQGEFVEGIRSSPPMHLNDQEVSPGCFAYPEALRDRGRSSSSPRSMRSVVGEPRRSFSKHTSRLQDELDACSRDPTISEALDNVESSSVTPSTSLTISSRSGPDSPHGEQNRAWNVCPVWTQEETSWSTHP
jgi:hypothetical protein